MTCIEDRLRYYLAQDKATRKKMLDNDTDLWFFLNSLSYVHKRATGATTTEFVTGYSKLPADEQNLTLLRIEILEKFLSEIGD